MEHRLSRRFDCDIQLLLVIRGFPVAVGRARNISRHGMFIGTEFRQIGIWQPVDVELLSAPLSAGLPRRLRMIVARKTGSGIGVELEHGETDQDRTLALLTTDAFADTHPQPYSRHY